jgi:hypothetical protein
MKYLKTLNFFSILSETWLLLGCSVRSDVGGRKKAPAGTQFSCPPVLVGLVSHGDDITPPEFEFTVFLK